MRAPGKVKLEKIETKIFHKKLKERTRHQYNLNFEDLTLKYQERQRTFEGSLLDERQREEERFVSDR